MSLKERLGLDTEPLFLMDGSAFIYRGFFANRDMRRSDGFPTNALVVVTRVLLRILREERPRYFLFAKDGRGANFRHDIFPQYKANREAMPEDLVRQLEPVRRMVRALGLRFEETGGFEADDGIASLAARFASRLPVVIVGGDKDLKQCLASNVFMWDPAAREEKLYDEAAFRAESGVAPAVWPDVQALVGDPSDNIPGVPGIGPKTARQIFELCPSLEDIRDHFDRLPPKIQEKLRGHLDAMFTWRRLTRLARDRWTAFSLSDLAVAPMRADACLALAREFELVSLRREMAAVLRLQDVGGSEGEGFSAAPLTLFDAPAPQSFRPAADAGSLPDCAGREVALIWPRGIESPPHVAVSVGKDVPEYLWTGTAEDLCPWLENAGKLVLADAKALLAAPRWNLLFHGGKELPCFDLGVAAYLLSSDEADYAWPRLATHWGGALQKNGMGPAGLALSLAVALEARLAASDLTELYKRLELPLIPVLAHMEKRGVAIDKGAFRAFLEEVQGELDRISADIHRQAGKTFNIRSSQQLAGILFDDLKLPAPRKTGGGRASTDQQALERLAGRHPVVDSILRFRKLEKMRSTYLDPLPRLVDAHGRIHTTFNQKATGTGRLSSSNPNLQNIPVRGPLGKRMRACFVAGRDCVLVSADYSQVELRVLAHMSQDPVLLDSFRRGEDIHARTAALVFDVPQENVSPEQRRNAKTINFGLIYGMGAQKLGQELGIGLAEARDFISRYFSRLTGLKVFYERVEAVAREQGYVTTLGGRRRLLPDIRSNNGQAYALARRQAINSVIQGSAADIIKLAMLAVDGDAELRDMGARLLLQVHDELLLEAPRENAREAAMRTAELMEQVAPGGERLAAPLVVDWGIGADWGTAH